MASMTMAKKPTISSQTGIEQYFQLDSDPGETHNAVADAECQGRVSALREILRTEEPELFR